MKRAIELESKGVKRRRTGPFNTLRFYKLKYSVGWYLVYQPGPRSGGRRAWVQDWWVGVADD